MVSLIFTSGPAPGRVLSSFNSHCRLAVIFEQLMNLRRTFPSVLARTKAFDAVDAVSCSAQSETLAYDFDSVT